MSKLFSYQYKTDGCQGPPQAMYTFDLNRKHPAFFDFVTLDMPLGMCGLSELDTFKCCYQSLDLSSSLYNSGGHQAYDDQFQIPKGANGSTYCSLTNVLNYTSIMVLGNNQCVEGTFKCTGTAIQVFPNDNCTGQPQTIPLTSIAVNRVSDVLGSFSGQLLAIKGNMKFDWTGYAPSALFVPDLKSPQGASALAFAILTILLGVVGFLYFVIQSRLVRNLQLGRGISLLLVTAYAILHFARQFVAFPSITGDAVYVQFQSMSIGLGTLGFGLGTVYDLINGWQHKRFVLLGFVIVHFGLAGSWYLQALMIQESAGIEQWEFAIFGWILLLFTLDLVYVYVRSKTWMYFIGCLFLSVIWVVLQILQLFTFALGDDRNWVAVEFTLLWLLMIHFVLVGVMPTPDYTQELDSLERPKVPNRFNSISIFGDADVVTQLSRIPTVKTVDIPPPPEDSPKIENQIMDSILGLGDVESPKSAQQYEPTPIQNLLLKA
ncbi:hypothetical protein EDD86DRAFT_256382 [Gorgonomyces haynaldii]|nr:hypothetical protein EDD86DRAFT_256382 [Gorgonomyces haynaldii]